MRSEELSFVSNKLVEDFAFWVGVFREKSEREFELSGEGERNRLPGREVPARGGAALVAARPLKKFKLENIGNLI